MSDEQRKQFEANFLACSPMSLPSDFTRDSVGGYENDYLQQRWHGWVEGQRARDAEVQALRKALIAVRDELEWVYKDIRAEHIFLRALRQADAALAGGETGETETAHPAEVRTVSGDRNRTIRLTIDMTYNAQQMHYDDPEGIRWFNEEVLGGALQMWSDEIGDWIGSVQIVEPPASAPADLCSVCGHPAQPSLTLNLLPVCTNCVRTGKAFNKEEA